MIVVAIRLVSYAALAYMALPLIVLVASSLTATSFLAFPPQGISLAWYRMMLADPTYMAGFATSTVLATVATLAAVVLAVPAALAIARRAFPGTHTLSSVLMSPLILPHIVLGAALLQFGTSIGLARSFNALLVGHVVIITPFVLRSVLPQLTEEQRNLEEASADLGASPLTTFFLVTLPQIRSGIGSGATFAFISSWINVELSIFNATAELTTIPVKLFNYVQYTIDPTIAAVSSVTILAAAFAIIILELTIGLDVLSERQ
ncbi:MAG: ABC transporter permease [Hyphomicrobiaceae bacterium]|nr:MAG: ABC transporter permease [Hyphomicrobiaceae bacterium]